MDEKLVTQMRLLKQYTEILSNIVNGLDDFRDFLSISAEYAHNKKD
jgi:hypothetical protein